MPGLASRRGARALGALTLWLVAALHLAGPAAADDPIRTKLTVAAYRQKIWDLEDKADSTYDKLKDEDKVWDSDSSSVDDTACKWKWLGTAFEFKQAMAVHQVVIDKKGSKQSDYLKSRGMQVRVGNSAGINDDIFGETGYQACNRGEFNSGSPWDVRENQLSRTGKYVSVVVQAKGCRCKRRRRGLQQVGNEDGIPAVVYSDNATAEEERPVHGRRLGACDVMSCGKIYIDNANAYQYSCAPGTYPNNVHSFDNGNCKPCENGFWCPGGVLGQAFNTYKKACPPGTIGTGARKRSEADGCDSCPAGTLLAGSACVACSSGSYCPKDASSEVPCQQGFYCATPATQQACADHKYCPARSTSQQPCTGGYVCVNGERSPCPSGSYCAAGDGFETTCPTGSYCPTQSAEPIACASGQSCPPGSSQAAPCPTGYYCPNGIAIACPLGTFGAGSGSSYVSQCSPCPAGTFGSAAGKPTAAAACSDCAEGSWSRAGSTSCFPQLVSVAADDTDGVVTGFSAADTVTLVFGTPVADPTAVAVGAQAVARPPVKSSSSSAHGQGIYAAIVFWSRSAADPNIVHCSSPDPSAIASVAALAGVPANAVVSPTALLGNGATELDAEWTTPTTLRVSVRVPDSVDRDLIDVDASLLQAFPAPGRIGAAASPSNTNDQAGANSLVVTGGWGVAGPPALKRAVVRDTGRAEGLGPGDSIELQFNQMLGSKSLAAVARALGASSVARAIVELWPRGASSPLSGWEGEAVWAVRESASQDARLVSAGDEPAQNTSAILVTITSAPDAATLSPAETATLMGGRISVRVLREADLRGTPPMHVLPPANNSVVATGSWGEPPATPVFRSHSGSSAIVSWREPHRPEGTLSISAWVSLGLKGFVVMWCDAGEVSNEPTSLGDDMVAHARLLFPWGLANASDADSLAQQGVCSAAFVSLPPTDIELLAGMSLPLLATSKTDTRPSRWLLVGVAAVFNNVVGTFAPAVDATPTELARAALGGGTRAQNQPLLNSVECVAVDWTDTSSAGAPIGCVPSSAALTPALRRACRCRVQAQDNGENPVLLRRVGGSAFSKTVAMAVDGVFTTSELGTAGGEFFSVIGDGFPISGFPSPLSADHERLMSPTVVAALAELASRAASPLEPLWNAPPGEARSAVVLARQPDTPGPAVPYLTLSYGGGTGGKSYVADVDECTITTEGHVLRCLSLPGVGRGHSVNVTVNGERMPGPPRSASYVGHELVTSYGAVARSTMDYAAPYIQSFVYDTDAGLPTVGGTTVRLTGRHFGPAGASHVDSVRFTPSRHNAFEFIAANCTVVTAHVMMECVTPANAGDQAYWNATVAGQESLLPSTSATVPEIDSLQLLTRDMLASGSGDNAALRRAAMRILGSASAAAGNSSAAPDAGSNSSSSSSSSGGGAPANATGSGNTTESPTDSDPLLAAFDAAVGTGAASLDELPTSGGSLVLIRGHDFGPDMSFIARVWAVRPDGVLKQLFSQDVDAARRGTLPAAPSGCEMVVPHTLLLCRTLPGAGSGYYWRVQVLDQSSDAANKPTAYASIVIEGMTPSELPSQGGTLVVAARNLPPENDDLVLRLGFNGGNISRITRSITSPLAEFEFVAPPVVLERLTGPRNSTCSPDALNESPPPVLVPLTLTVANVVASAVVPIALPSITAFDADSIRRRPSALDVDTPPESAGGSEAILLEVYGSSFGGSSGELCLFLDEELCVPLSPSQIALHLSLPGGFDPHTQFFCWTSKRRGAPALIDIASRSALDSLDYDFDTIKTPPTPTSIVASNETSGNAIGTFRGLHAQGGELLGLVGVSLAAVTRVELVLLSPPSPPSQPVSQRKQLFSAPCVILRRRDVVEAGGEDPCPWLAGDEEDLPTLCAADTQIYCRSTAGVGASLFVRAVSASASAQVEGWSATALASYLAPELLGVFPSKVGTTGGDDVEVHGRHFGSPLVGTMASGSTPGLTPPSVTVGGRACTVTFRNDTLIRCAAPPGLRSSETVAVVVQGQAGEVPSGTLPLKVGYYPPVIARVRGFELEGGLPAAEETPEVIPGRLELSSRGGWLQVTGSDFGASPTVRLEPEAGGAGLDCTPDDSVMPSASVGDNETWCRLPEGDGTSYRVVLSTAAASDGGRDATAPMRFGFRRPSVVAVYFDNLDATSTRASSSTAGRDVSQSSLGRAATAGNFVVHVVGDSFSASARVVIGGLACSVIAGIVQPAAPVGLGAVVEVGDAVRGASYDPVDLDTSALRDASASASVSARPPVTVTSPAFSERRWVTHELVSCLAPAGTGITTLQVFSSSQQSSLPVEFRYDAPVVMGLQPAFVQADTLTPGDVKIPDVVLEGLNLGSLASELTTGARLVNVTAIPLLAAPRAPDSIVAGRRRSLAASASGYTVGPAVELCARSLMQSPHRELLCTPRASLTVGVLLVSLGVGGQVAEQRAVLSLCPAGFFGGPGEACKACPQGAFCAGGFAEPQSLPGFYKRAPSSFLACNPRIACRGAQASGVPDAAFDTTKLGLGRWQPGFGLPEDSAASDGTAGAAARALQDTAADPAAPDGDVVSDEEKRLGSWDEAAGANQLPIEAVFPKNGSVANLLLSYRAQASAASASQCIGGYRGVRCAACADRFYRLEGRCEPCPELAWLMIPGFILGLLALLGVASFLQKKNVQLAGLSVGVDMMQILSVFAALDLSWPVEIRTVWTTVSMTTFSIQILAPECSVKLEYADKFFAVAAIPPVLAGGCVLIVLAELARRFWKRWRPKPTATTRPKPWCQRHCAACTACASNAGCATCAGCPAWMPCGRPARSAKRPGAKRTSMIDSRLIGSIASTSGLGALASAQEDAFERSRPASGVAGSAVDAGLGLALTLLYFAYLTATRNALQPLDCTDVEAAAGTGRQRVMQLEPSVVCDVNSDKTYARVLPWAVITSLVYGMGIPALFAIMLFSSRSSIIADQKLLAVGEGHSRATNPHFATRKRLGRLYADYKPEVFWWRLVLTARKALVATVSILFTGTPVFAASATALILFVSFLLHSRYQPFLHAPPVSNKFLALADELDPDKDAAGDSKKQDGKAGGSAARKGRKKRCRCRAALPAGLSSCLRNTSPIFAVCLAAAESDMVSRRVNTRPAISLEPPTPRKDPAKARNGIAARLVRSVSQGASALRSSASPLSRAGTAVPRAATPAAGKSGATPAGTISSASQAEAAGPALKPSARMLAFAAAATAAIEAKAREEAREAARLAKESSLSFVFDYNTLEGSFLITGVLVLMGGLAFSSNAIEPGTPAYFAVVAAIVLLVAGALGSFVWILGFELYRSLRFADVLTKARLYQDSFLAKQSRAAKASSSLAAFQGGPTPASRAVSRFKSLVAQKRAARVLAGEAPKPAAAVPPRQLEGALAKKLAAVGSRPRTRSGKSGAGLLRDRSTGSMRPVRVSRDGIGNPMHFAAASTPRLQADSKALSPQVSNSWED
ncbi:hypothetical protein FNF29_06496 [Cafeteria roenbergensis]|uniref:IPT/TIG domain-containing protein n=1 Tax=Cafeteria roenbergensis TaxID=33653 RepID=A0A5A8C7T3_CAFRO|nr:hypothetical protein FNF29_06496 [Cafeteria roenbergensis]|eukprot:KAA0148714.1 hypothetical protein FNF29_06496 [Cafeteria roenbergensis]